MKKMCIQDTKFFFLNGRLIGRTNASRGVRQGNHLYPFLFFVVSDVLSVLIEKG